MRIKSQLFDGAEHSLARYAAELARLYFNAVRQLCNNLFSFGRNRNGNKRTFENVLCGCNNLKISVSEVDLTDDKSFSVRMLLDFRNKSDPDIFNLFSELLIGFNL